MDAPLALDAAAPGAPADGELFATFQDAEAEASRFFLADTSLRLRRLTEQATGYWVFATLLFCRMLAPGGEDLWSWLDADGSWLVVFLPLFVLDGRNLVFWKYLHEHRRRFPAFDSARYLLIGSAEAFYKVLLCLHLACADCRSILSIKVIMLPYGLAYLLYFVLGHFVPMDDADRPEGCNVLSGLLGDLGRFLAFVLLVSISMKVVKGDGEASFTWQAAFWPCWGLEGIVVLGVALLFPICLGSIVANRPQVLMLSWVIVFGILFGTATFMSMANVTIVLDDRLCPNPPFASVEDVAKYGRCREKLVLALLPWVILLPVFAASTMLLRRRLAHALHSAWFDPAQNVSFMPEALPPAMHRWATLPAPEVMFKVTGTYYSRAFVDPTSAASVMQSVALPVAGAPDTFPSDGAGPRPASPQAWASFPGASSLLSGSVLRNSRVVDPSASILSARGATFCEIVEAEQLCFICFDDPPAAVLLECGHAGLCQDCAVHLFERRPQCPICRSSISCVVRLREDLPVPSHHFQPPAAARRGLGSGTAASLGSSAALAPGSAAAAVREAREAPPPALDLEASELASGGPGTAPWPAAAKARAVVVEVVRRLEPFAGARGPA